ncbi:MAG: glycosyltransferase [Goleter apudmare HA4340-LM2]|jgi:glycosyltransferase involved in cell wall biosynthesis|nr:glycosyltransferase [Goleter apudmare HA4340-LM2]
MNDASVAETKPISQPSIVKKPTISIVVEGYNETKDLGTAHETIAALRNQDFPIAQMEIILVGNPEQVREWQQTYSGNVEFFAVKTVEFASANYYELKNGGAEIASGNIIAFTDSDVSPQSSWVRAIVAGINNGADVVVGQSLFRHEGGLAPDTPIMQACASISWGWVLGKGKAVGFMDHNMALRTEVFRDHRYRTDLGRVCTSPLLFRSLDNAGLAIAIQSQQQAMHFFTWRYWMRLHFRYGYEVFHLRRLDQQYPNQWIAKTKILEPLVTMLWHMLLDIPRWFRFNRILGKSLIYSWITMPILIILSAIARGLEMLGMYATILAPNSMKYWSENF